MDLAALLKRKTLEEVKHGRKTIAEEEVSASKDKAVSPPVEATIKTSVTVTAATEAAKKGVSVPVAE